ncbi:MAG: glycoside hydrolase domain-containing protein [Acidimicrobiales bacterium]
MFGWAVWPAASPPGTYRTDGGAYWGVDSVATMGSRLSSVQRTYDATPSFWGRYLSDCRGRCGHDLTRAEARQDLGEGVRLLLVVADRSGRHDVGRRAGAADGRAAVAAARALGVPPGVAIFKDLENESRENAAFIVAWYEAVAAGGYAPGYYLNAEPGEDGGAAYCRAVATDPLVGTSFLWASESEPDAAESTPPGRAPAYSSGPLPAVFPACAGRRVVWQYSEADQAGVDEDEATTLSPFWG